MTWGKELKVVIAANSHPQAKNIGGVTLHAAAGLHTIANVWSDAALKPKSDGDRAELKDLTEDVGLVIFEECSLTEAALSYAVNIRYAYGREQQWGTHTTEWRDLKTWFGRCPHVLFLGDIVQQRPRGLSLFDNLHTIDTTSGDRGAQHMVKQFQRCTEVYELTGGMRFRDDYLSPFLNLMRTRGGARIPDDLWNSVAGQEVKPNGDPRLNTDDFRNGDEAAIAWATVSRMMASRTKRDAALLGQTLHIFQAVDIGPITDEQAKKLLQHPNIKECGSLQACCAVHIAQRVRFATHMCRKLRVVAETAGTVRGNHAASANIDTQKSGARPRRSCSSNPTQRTRLQCMTMVRKRAAGADVITHSA